MSLNLDNIKIKPTTKLFNNKYKYKIVIVTALSYWFRGENILKFDEKLKTFNTSQSTTNQSLLIQVRKEGGTGFAQDIHKYILSMTDYIIRVEYPFLHVYTNNFLDIEKLAEIKPSQVKYVFKPEDESVLISGTVISKRLDFKYKITLGQTHTSHDSFVEWCNSNPKVRISKGTIGNLKRKRCYQPGHVYVKDDKTLTMIKMFIGGCINKIENVIKIDSKNK